MNTEEMTPPPELSRKIINAIHGALEEEKVPRPRRLLKVFGASLLSLILLSLPLLLLFRKEVNVAWCLALFSWWVLFSIGFYLHYSPQPRLVVPGYWSPFIFARLLIVSSILTAVEIILCPSFVFLESPLPWSPFEGITHWSMNWGGMNACMFVCGFLFASMGGLASFAVVGRVLGGTRLKALLQPLVLLFSTQAPVLIIQASDTSLRMFLPFWIVGCLSGLAVALFLVRSVGIKLRKKKFLFYKKLICNAN